MYFVFVNNDNEATRLFENALQEVDSKSVLSTIPSGYELIQLLQNVKGGESFPDLIILTPKFLRISGAELLELLKTDDLYRLIPVIMLLPEKNQDHEAVCHRLGTEFMDIPTDKLQWKNAIDKMYTAFS